MDDFFEDDHLDLDGDGDHAIDKCVLWDDKEPNNSSGNRWSLQRVVALDCCCLWYYHQGCFFCTHF